MANDSIQLEENNVDFNTFKQEVLKAVQEGQSKQKPSITYIEKAMPSIVEVPDGSN